VKKQLGWIFLFLFLAAESYREVQILIDRGSWSEIDTWIPLWYIDWTSPWKNFDSFHFIHGLAIVFLFEFAVNHLPKYKIKFLAVWFDYQVWVVAYWIVFFQLRNLFMHHIF